MIDDMKEDFAEQYQTPCVDLRDCDPLPAADAVVLFANEIGARYQSEPGEPEFVIQFPRRPQELYTLESLRRSLPRESAEVTMGLPLPEGAGAHLLEEGPPPRSATSVTTTTTMPPGGWPRPEVYQAFAEWFSEWADAPVALGTGMRPDMFAAYWAGVQYGRSETVLKR